MKILFKNADILLRSDKGRYLLKNAFLATKDDRIAYIGGEPPQDRSDRVVDMRGRLLLPGLYNCHNHAAMVALRGAGSDMPLDRWLRDVIFPLERRLTAQTVLTASRLAVAEMLACGTVSFSDMYFFPEQTAEAVAETGIKANLTKHLQMTTEENAQDQIRDSFGFYRTFHGAADGRIRIDMGVHALYTCDKNAVSEYALRAAETDARIHFHLSETRKEFDECREKYGVTPTEWFRDAGAFRCPAAAAHCVVMTPGDVDILKEAHASAIHVPTSNLKLGSGLAPIPQMLEKGVNVALGTDGAASNDNLNLFEEMHLASVIHNGYTGDPTILPTDDVLDMATVNGAMLQGRTDCGDLRVGYKADIIAIDLRRPHLVPAFDPGALLVYSAQGSDVCMTMVDGKILYENGTYSTLDVEKVMAEAEAIRLA